MDIVSSHGDHSGGVFLDRLTVEIFSVLTISTFQSWARRSCLVIAGRQPVDHAGQLDHAWGQVTGRPGRHRRVRGLGRVVLGFGR
jgi:hypothetical protein